MKLRRRVALGILAGMGAAALATRSYRMATRSGSARGVHLVGNVFPAMQHLARIAQAQDNGELHVSFKLTSEFESEVEHAFSSGGESAFDAAAVSMSEFTDLYGRSQIAPMTDLVDKHGARFGLEERMLVRVDGEVMALAFMQNTQNLYYRGDLLERYGLDVPRTYGQMVQVARRLRKEEPDLQYPIAQGYGKGFDVAIDFANVFSSLGGRYFEPGSAEPAFNDAYGVEAIAQMRSLMPYMTPNALASNADDVMNQLQQGRAALGVLWASRAARMDDPLASRVVGRIHFAAAPAVHSGGPSAAHLWWDGFVMPRNAGPGREQTFLVLMAMLSEQAVRSGNDLAIWVRSCYRPGRFGRGVALAEAAGAPEWPGEPFYGLLHNELGRVLPDALSGQRSPEEVLNEAARAFRATAQQKGYLREGSA